MHELTAFQRDVLFTLAGLSETNSYGLGIKRAVGDVRGEDVNHGRLYPNLDDLESEGLIEKGEKDDRTNSYELTADGREALREFVEWQAVQLEAGE